MALLSGLIDFDFVDLVLVVLLPLLHVLVNERFAVEALLLLKLLLKILSALILLLDFLIDKTNKLSLTYALISLLL